MDLEELYHKYRIRLKQSLFTTFASIGLIVCTATLVLFILFHNVSIKTKIKTYVKIYVLMNNKYNLYNNKTITVILIISLLQASTF